jgi:hypothetical protein
MQLGLSVDRPQPRRHAVLAKFRAGLTYANVMATVAVFIALGGSSFAALTVTGRNVKDSSLSGRDLRNNSVTGKDVKGIKSGDVTDDSLLARDFKGGQLPAGPKGDKGDKGDPGTNGGTNAVIRRNDVLAAGAGDITVHCNPGERAIGGGVGRTDGLTNGLDNLYASYPVTGTGPTPDGSAATGWNAAFSRSSGSGITWYVVCVSP